MKIGTMSRLSMKAYVFNLQHTTRMKNANDGSERASSLSEQSREVIKSLTDHLTDSIESSTVASVLKQYGSLFDTTTKKVITPIHRVIDRGNHPPISARPYFKTIQQRKDIQQEIDKTL
ncbi:unnamed protein product [Didymodactylos carnosus]|uniref:Uncharacterized protein n=1 Tax=Didymodactylos carnosus TaxID=1234261 RepID=A0A8S2VMG4_9BILA|nr:unnamed protein product [Didymodactylos carnosus]CAF3990396.1 unnamed protein product [Didymodactylos carnosus]CAF4391164.1 unnamed protein product [Didymodactylos carnosus]